MVTLYWFILSNVMQWMVKWSNQKRCWTIFLKNTTCSWYTIQFYGTSSWLLTFIKTSEVVPITFSAPSFFLGSRFSDELFSIWTQNIITGSRMFFLFWQASAKNTWAATTGETKSSNISTKKTTDTITKIQYILVYIYMYMCISISQTHNLILNPNLFLSPNLILSPISP